MTIKSQRATIEYVEGISVDGYMMPNGEFRVGMVGASLALGYAENWLYRLTTREGKALKALQGIGYTGLPLDAELDSINGGGTKATTISLSDWQRLKIYAAQQGKMKAVALLAYQSLSSDADLFTDAFALPRWTVEQKRAMYCAELAKNINWLEEDRQEWRVIEDQELFLLSLN
jgi:hypothetical protein